MTETRYYLPSRDGIPSDPGELLDALRKLYPVWVAAREKDEDAE